MKMKLNKMVASFKFWRVLSKVSGIVIGMIALVMTIAWLSGMFIDKVPPGRVATQRQILSGQSTDEVHEITKAYVEEAVGTLKASSRTVLSAKVLASIESMNVVAGDIVSPGQVLVELDSREFRTRLEQARQALDVALASTQLAENNFKRAESLIDQRGISRADYDQANRDVQVARSEQLRAREAVTEAEVMLSYTTISAPKTGRIVDRLAEPGDIARPGEPLLVLYDAASLRLEAPVMEDLAVTLKIGDTLKVFIDAINREIEATIGEVVPQADAPSRTFLVKAILPQQENLYEGMFGRLRIPAGQRRHLCLNQAAIIRIGQLEFADVVLADGSIQRRMIKTGQLGMPGRQEVLSGLDPGERVLLHSRKQPADTDSTADPSVDPSVDLPVASFTAVQDDGEFDGQFE